MDFFVAHKTPNEIGHAKALLDLQGNPGELFVWGSWSVHSTAPFERWFCRGLYSLEAHLVFSFSSPLISAPCFLKEGIKQLGLAMTMRESKENVGKGRMTPKTTSQVRRGGNFLDLGKAQPHFSISLSCSRPRTSNLEQNTKKFPQFGEKEHSSSRGSCQGFPVPNSFPSPGGTRGTKQENFTWMGFCSSIYN